VETHSCISESDILPEALDYDSYNGYTYSYTLTEDTESPTTKGVFLPAGKCYYGAHGSDDQDKNVNVDDGYLQSCRDEDFKLLFSNGVPVFNYKVHGLYPNWTESKDAEHIFLTKNDAAKSNMFFNTHNGFATHSQIDYEKCRELVKEIKRRENCKWGWTLEAKSKHTDSKVGSFQVKSKDDNSHKVDVKNRINDAFGVTDITKNPDIDPIVICEERGIGGKDMRIDGNVTVGAILHKDCKAMDVPVIRLPVPVHLNFSDDELRYVALTLNASGKKIKQPTNIDDAIKYLYGTSKNGTVPYDTKVIRTAIKKDWSFSKAQCTSVMDGVKDMIFAKEQAKVNMMYASYSDEDKTNFCKELKETYKETEKRDVIAFAASAKMGDKLPARILKAIDEDIEDSKNPALIPREPCTKVVMGIHFAQSSVVRNNWRTVDWPKLSKQFANLNSSYELTYEEFPLLVPDTKN
jgi:hypothetical protein